MKYIQQSFSIPQTGSSNYEQTFVRCSCESGSECCVRCDSCGVKVRNGMMKWHECDPVKKGLHEISKAMEADAVLTIGSDIPESAQGMAEYMSAGGPDAV